MRTCPKHAEILKEHQKGGGNFLCSSFFAIPRSEPSFLLHSSGDEGNGNKACSKADITRYTNSSVLVIRQISKQ